MENAAVGIRAGRNENGQFHPSRQEVLHKSAKHSTAHAVKSVEREFGVELFWREGKNLKLTDDGKAFSEKAQAAINLLDDMHDIANENRRSLQPIGVIVSTALLSALPADASGVFFDYPGGGYGLAGLAVRTAWKAYAPALRTALSSSE